MAQQRRLEGRVALVTGAAGGVGQGIVEALAQQGCHVAVNHVDTPATATAVAATVAGHGVRGVVVAGDVRSAPDWDRMVTEVTSAFGRLDLLVNNAGVQTWAPLLEAAEADWDRVIDTNLKGCFLGMRAAGRFMRDHGGGAIVNIGSGANRMPFPNLASYTASKGGIEMLTKVAALELGPFRIRVNCVAPGAIEIERTRHELPDYAGTFAAITPLGRVGTPADVGHAVVLLASDDAAFITGQTIGADGGLFCQPPFVKR